MIKIVLDIFKTQNKHFSFLREITFENFVFSYSI